MNTSKIIKAYIGAGTYSTTEPIIQGDYGYILQIEGAELPAIYRVDFSNDRHKGEALPVYGNENGVEIPEELIATGKDIFAFYYYIEEGFGKTAYTWKIPNDTRAQNGDREPTPAQQDSIDQLIVRSNDAVERAEDAQQAIEDMSVSATTLAEGESATVTKTEQDGVVHLEFGIPKGATGDTPTITASKTGDTTYIYADRVEIAQIKDGTNGDDGYSPTASVTKSGKVATITITDQNGTTSAQVEDGTDGTDGYSPTVTITPITGGHRITITDADGEHSADVMDGDDYTLTAQDKQDIAELVDVPVDDVQINGSSIVVDGVANVPTASASRLGVIKTSNANGIYVNSNGDLSISEASSANVKTGTNVYKPITPHIEHEATFFGLAKAAGDTTQSQSSNAVGTYTDEAKVTIQKMLGIYQAPWELIREDTFTNEEEADHIISTDANGETFELTDVVLELIVPTHDEDTVIADYLRVYFSEQNVVVATAFLGNSSTKTITANSAINMAIASITQDNGLMCIEINQWASRTNRSNKQILIEEGLGTTVPYRINNASIDSIRIGKITGFMKYRIYGRRKWQ